MLPFHLIPSSKSFFVLAVTLTAFIICLSSIGIIPELERLLKSVMRYGIVHPIFGRRVICAFRIFFETETPAAVLAKISDPVVSFALELHWIWFLFFELDMSNQIRWQLHWYFFNFRFFIVPTVFFFLIKCGLVSIFKGNVLMLLSSLTKIYCWKNIDLSLYIAHLFNCL